MRGASAQLGQRVGGRSDAGVARVERVLPVFHESDAAREAHGQAVPCYQRVRVVQAKRAHFIPCTHLRPRRKSFCGLDVMIRNFSVFVP